MFNALNEIPTGQTTSFTPNMLPERVVPRMAAVAEFVASLQRSTK